MLRQQTNKRETQTHRRIRAGHPPPPTEYHGGEQEQTVHKQRKAKKRLADLANAINQRRETHTHRNIRALIEGFPQVYNCVKRPA